MKTFLLSIVLACACVTTSDAQFPSLAKYRGHYFGVATPVGRCSNERIAIEIHVDSEGDIEGRVRNWDDVTLLDFTESLPFYGGSRFTTDITGLGDTVRGKFSSVGSVSGTITFEAGCKYTFKAWRRYKIAQ